MTGQLYAEIHADALTVYLVDVLELQLGGDKFGASKKSGWAHNEKLDNKSFKDGFEIKAQYAIDAFTPYIQIDGYGIMDKKLGIKTAVGFNVGAVAIDGGLNFDMNFANTDLDLSAEKKGVFSTTITLPIQFTINL